MPAFQKLLSLFPERRNRERPALRDFLGTGGEQEEFSHAERLGVLLPDNVSCKSLGLSISMIFS